ncbi:hypothetical protein B0H10DRAFT_2039992, partial [Mycena sp. CBHHK59/15]
MASTFVPRTLILLSSLWIPLTKCWKGYALGTLVLQHLLSVTQTTWMKTCQLLRVHSPSTPLLMHPLWCRSGAWSSTSSSLPTNPRWHLTNLSRHMLCPLTLHKA